MTEKVFTAIVAAQDIAEKSFATIEVNGVDIVICRLGGKYFAIENRCSHALSTFDNGRLRGFRIMCLVHGATFDVRDGSVLAHPQPGPSAAFQCGLQAA